MKQWIREKLNSVEFLKPIPRIPSPETVELIPLAKRFWAKVNKNGPVPTTCSAHYGNCWLWTGATNSDGYGHLKVARRFKYAHHVAWFLTTGIWSREHLLHACDTPACVRPSHLFEGNASINACDREMKARGGIRL